MLTMAPMCDTQHIWSCLLNSITSGCIALRCPDVEEAHGSTLPLHGFTDETKSRTIRWFV